jgi:bifunctional DNA-binding transcriptional regulator/antitoxin component of YhaV-PrlF toxin-antitoxin module
MSPVDVAKIVASDSTVSDKIRMLAGAGYERAEIARLLGKRYQHVRNVLEGDRVGARRRATLVNPTVTPRQASTASAASVGRHRRLVVGPGGEVVLPVEFLAALDLKPGDGVIVGPDGEGLSLVNGRVALRRAQALVQSHVPRGVSLVEELIADRRREAEAEERG